MTHKTIALLVLFAIITWAGAYGVIELTGGGPQGEPGPPGVQGPQGIQGPEGLAGSGQAAETFATCADNAVLGLVFRVVAARDRGATDAQWKQMTEDWQRLYQDDLDSCR